MAQQARLCQLLADQLRSGFSLKQALAFLRTTAEDLPPEVAVIEQHLLAGAAFLPELAPYLQENIYFQLTLTTHDGSLCLGLARAAKLLQLMATQRQRLRQLLAYPLGLFGGMGLLFATLQFGILPQLRTSLAPQTTGPRLAWQVWGGGLLGVSLLLLGGATLRWWWRQSSLQRAQGWLRVPLVGRIFRAYYAYYLADNLSQLVQSGLSVKQMIQTLNRLPDRALLHQLAASLDQRLNQGTSPMRWLHRQAYIPDDLILLLQKGSTPEQLARELTAYSRLQYQRLVNRSERGLAWVQPVLLTVVASLIVAAYLNLLLPLYHNLQGVYQ
ncbi:Type II secretory pathway/competence component [Levilactobacillus zymae]|nr:Type II secretory pathway/competence component [Levilactobacillus zymae]